MNKLLILLFIIISLSMQVTWAQEQSTDEIPSVGDIISNIMAGDNAYKTYNVIATNEAMSCIDGNKIELKPSLDKDTFYSTWKLSCGILNGSELCSKIKEEDKLDCSAPAKTPWYANVWEKTKSCGSGIKKSWQEFFQFMKQIAHYTVNKEIETTDKDGNKSKVGLRTKTNKQIGDAWSALNNYMATEITKHQDRYHVSKGQAFLAITSKMMNKFAKGLNVMIAQAAPKVGCYNYKAKTRVICQVLAEFFAEPFIMFKFIKLGPKALKGTRIARFFKFHKADKTVRKLASNKTLFSSSKLDFIDPNSKVTIEIFKHPNLHGAVAKNQDTFQKLFPDKKSLDELEQYLSGVKKSEVDDLAEVLNVLAQDKNKMTPKQYQEFIDEVKKGIRKSCE